MNTIMRCAHKIKIIIIILTVRAVQTAVLNVSVSCGLMESEVILRTLMKMLLKIPRVFIFQFSPSSLLPSLTPLYETVSVISDRAT